MQLLKEIFAIVLINIGGFMLGTAFAMAMTAGFIWGLINLF
jgi:hypothetical protein